MEPDVGRASALTGEDLLPFDPRKRRADLDGTEDDTGDTVVVDPAQKRLRQDGLDFLEAIGAIREDVAYIKATMDQFKNQLTAMLNEMSDMKKQTDKQKLIDLKDVKSRLQQALKERLIERTFFADELKNDVKLKTRQILTDLGKKKEYVDHFVDDAISMGPIYKYASEFWQSLRSQVRRKCMANEDEYQHWRSFDSKTFADKFAASLGCHNPPELKYRLAFLRSEVLMDGNFWQTAQSKWGLYDREVNKDRFLQAADARAAAALTGEDKRPSAAVTAAFPMD